MTFPMLADFALRLSSGLAAMLLVTSWRKVPLAFFRTHCHVMLGLLVLAALVASRSGVHGPIFLATLTAGVLSYFAAVSWGIGLPRVAIPVTLLILLATAGVLVAISRADDPSLWALNASGRLASATLMGATLTAMLLGHHYLIAPAMSIEPLKRFVILLGASLVVRSVLGAIGWAIWARQPGSQGDASSLTPLLLTIRWGMGVLGPAVAGILTWKTVQIRSTQSATGILYIAMTLVLFGELSAMILSNESGILF